MEPSPFAPETFQFFRDLARNNQKEWFEANRERYDDEVLEPSRLFVLQFRSYLREISAQFQAEPRVRGGSVFRIHTNRRFNPDRPPYKTHAGIQFRHRAGGDVHAPGFYLHLEPERRAAEWENDTQEREEGAQGGEAGSLGGCFVGLGIWRPDRESLTAIREAIVEGPGSWTAVTRDDEAFRSRFELGGDSLKLGPVGFDRDHPLIEDIKRKDFIAVSPVSEEAVVSDGFVEEFTAQCRAGGPFVRWLCGAVSVEF